MKLDEERVRGARERLGLTLTMVAQRAGTSKNTVLSAEHGGDIRPTTARKIAEALEVEITDLIGEQAHPKAQASPSQQLTLNGLLAEERRDPTPYELNAIAILEDFCGRLEDFLAVADRTDVAPATWLIQVHGVLDRAALSLPLTEKESTRLLLVPVVTRLLQLADKLFEAARKAGVDVIEEEARQSRELVRELTQRINAA
ncbi:MAG: helix-turn-helix domain-containing protein [Actinomycetota bacterium]|nr:helix-turn-helix domain-containing protein [Actinomycetota bacterium]